MLQRIRRTSLAVSMAALAASTAAAAEPEGGAVSLRAHRIGSLVAPAIDEAVSPVGILPLLHRGAGIPVTRSLRPGMPAEEIAELLRAAVGDARFEAAGRSLTVGADSVYVRQTPENQERARRVLSLLESAVTRGTQVELRVLELGPGGAGKLGGSILTTAERDTLLRDSAVKTIAIYTANGAFGSRLAFGTRSTRRILADYSVEIAQEAAIADPLVLAIGEGLSASVTVVPCGAQWFDLEASAEFAILGNPIRQVALNAPKLGRLDLPEFAVARVGGTGVVPAGGSLALVAAAAEGAASLAVLVTPKAAGAESGAVREDGPEALEARVADLGTIGYSPRRFLTPSIRSLEDLDAESAYSGQLDTLDSIQADQVEFAIDEALATDATTSADSGSASVRVLPSRRAIVLGDAATQDSAAGALSALVEDRRRTIEATVAFVTLTAEESAAADDGALGERLLAAAKAGRAGSSIVLVPVVSGDQAAFSIGREFAYIADYEVEVAQKSTVANPQIGFEFSGRAAEVRATRSSNGGRTDVEVRFTLAESVAMPAPMSHGEQDLGVIESTATTRASATRRFSPSPGRAEAALVGRTSDGRAVALVVTVAEP